MAVSAAGIAIGYPWPPAVGGAVEGLRLVLRSRLRWWAADGLILRHVCAGTGITGSSPVGGSSGWTLRLACLRHSAHEPRTITRRLTGNCPCYRLLVANAASGLRPWPPGT